DPPRRPDRDGLDLEHPSLVGSARDFELPPDDPASATDEPWDAAISRVRAWNAGDPLLPDEGFCVIVVRNATQASAGKSSGIDVKGGAANLTQGLGSNSSELELALGPTPAGDHALVITDKSSGKKVAITATIPADGGA